MTWIQVTVMVVALVVVVLPLFLVLWGCLSDINRRLLVIEAGLNYLARRMLVSEPDPGEYVKLDPPTMRTVREMLRFMAKVTRAGPAVGEH